MFKNISFRCQGLYTEDFIHEDHVFYYWATSLILNFLIEVSLVYNIWYAHVQIMYYICSSLKVWFQGCGNSSVLELFILQTWGWAFDPSKTKHLTRSSLWHCHLVSVVSTKSVNSGAPQPNVWYYVSKTPIYNYSFKPIICFTFCMSEKSYGLFFSLSDLFHETKTLYVQVFFTLPGLYLPHSRAVLY